MLADKHGTRSFAELARAGVIHYSDGYRTKQSELGLPGFPILRVAQVADGSVEPGTDGVDHVREEFRAKIGPKLSMEGDIVLTTKGTFGRRAIIRPGAEGFVYSPQVCYFRVQDSTQIDSRYLYYWLGGPDFLRQAGGMKSQTDMADYLSLRDLGAIQPTLPPIQGQKAIASTLGALDDKIEHNRRTALLLERLARVIFKAWFVDFEPVRAKAAGATSFPSMPQEAFDALPTAFVDSDIGPVPEGWEVGSTRDLAALSKTQINPQESPTEIFDHFSIPAFDAGMRPLAEAGGTIKSNKFAIVDGCVLLSKLNPRISRVWLPPSPSDRRQIASTEFLVIAPYDRRDRHYLYCQFQQMAFREEIAQRASGTSNSHQRVRPEEVMGKANIVPSASIRGEFADIVDPLFAVVSAVHTESEKLAAVRDYLLPRLLSGDVRVVAAGDEGAG